MTTQNSIQAYLDSVIAWAKEQPEICKAALVGSYARDAAREDSDIDIVLMIDEQGLDQYLEDPAWIEYFGPVREYQREDYGKVQSIRAWYFNGMEVEYGLTAPDWDSLPLDDGTREVIENGYRLLFVRSGY